MDFSFQISLPVATNSKDSTGLPSCVPVIEIENVYNGIGGDSNEKSKVAHGPLTC